MNTPYGGKLVSLRNHAPPADGNEWPAVALTATEYLDLHLMADGVFSPVESFFNAEQTRQVMEESRLDRHVWSVPILLSEKDSQHPPGQGVRLTYDGVTQATGVLCDRFSLDEKAIHGFLGTSDAKHPGLKFFSSSHYQGLTHLNVFGPTPAFAKSINPRRARQIFDAKKWKTIAVFHTRNFPHLGHEHLQQSALSEPGIDGLFIHPLVGKKKEGDVEEAAIVDAYQALLKTYPLHRTFFATLGYSPRFVGPKEILVHAIMRRNFGCTHFIAGRDHGGVHDYYPHFAAQKILSENADEIGMIPLAYSEVVFCQTCGKTVFAGACASTHHQQKISGTVARRNLRENKNAPQLMRPDIERVLEKHLRERNHD